jgi:hypothetical protein
MQKDFSEIMNDVLSENLTLRAALEAAFNAGMDASNPPIASSVQIVIAPRGWIFIGYTHEDKEERKLIIEKCNVIRTWGTTKGLGELTGGPLSGTKLDKCATTRIPIDAVIAQIDCEDSKWQTHL